jgi:membrane protease YdiL (CAAX protease family)
MGDGKHWLAILCSALLFGIAHGNSAQFVHAVLAGMLLGWLYYRTKSVVPGIAFHLVNNTVTYIVVNILPPGMEDITISQLAGGSTTHMILYIVFSLCIFIPALFQLNRLLKRVGEK